MPSKAHLCGAHLFANPRGCHEQGRGPGLYFSFSFFFKKDMDIEV